MSYLILVSCAALALATTLCPATSRAKTLDILQGLSRSTAGDSSIASLMREAPGSSWPEPALVISSLALLFTVGSYWWMHWRRGRIIVSPPRSFGAACKGEKDLLLLQLPLVFYNDGAAARVVQNLRLRLRQDEHESAILHFNNTVEDMATSGGRQWARQFAVGGRKTQAGIFVFQHSPGGFKFAPPRCTVVLQGKLDRDKRWRELLVFDLQTPQANLGTLNGGALLPHDNEPDRFEC